MQSLCLFAKHWTPGSVKTRLAAAIGDQRAAEVYRAFVVTLAARLELVADHRTLWFAPAEERDAFSAIVGSSWQLRVQCGGDLGARMTEAIAAHLQEPDDCCVLLGTDSPNVPIKFIEQAFVALRYARLVLGPTHDSGYYLIGARGEPPPVLHGMPFSTPLLWQATLDRLAAQSWHERDDYVVLPPWYDVDTVADLDRLREELRRSIGSLDPHLHALAELLDRL